MAIILRHPVNHSRSEFYVSLIYKTKNIPCSQVLAILLQFKSNISFAKERNWLSAFLVQDQSSSRATGKPEGTAHFSATLLEAALDVLTLFSTAVYWRHLHYTCISSCIFICKSIYLLHLPDFFWISFELAEATRTLGISWSPLQMWLMLLPASNPTHVITTVLVLQEDWREKCQVIKMISTL